MSRASSVVRNLDTNDPNHTRPVRSPTSTHRAKVHKAVANFHQPRGRVDKFSRNVDSDGWGSEEQSSAGKRGCRALNLIDGSGIKDRWVFKRLADVDY